MPSLNVNLKNLNDIIIASIEETVSHLNVALDHINNVSIPSECDITLNSSKSDIESVKNNLKDLKNWCSNSVILYKQLEEKYVEEALLLPDDVIPLRKNRIKG